MATECFFCGKKFEKASEHSCPGLDGVLCVSHIDKESSPQCEQPATGPWCTDDPPKDGSRFLAELLDGELCVAVIHGNSYVCGSQIYFVHSPIHDPIRRWAEIKV